MNTNHSDYPEPTQVKSKHYMPPNPKILFTERIERELLSLKEGEWFVLSEKLKPESRESFIEIVKWQIAHEVFKRKNLCPEFNEEYSKVRMIKVESE